LKYHQQTFTAMKRTTRNWSEYNAGLKQRGSLTFWLWEDVLEAWYNRECLSDAEKSHRYFPV
jgi:hypothetical protein